MGSGSVWMKLFVLRFRLFCAGMVTDLESGAKVCVSMCRYISGPVFDWIWWLGISMSRLPRFRAYIWPVCLLAEDHVTFYDEISHFHLLIVGAVSKYRGFSQQLIGKSGEMPQNSTSCVIFPAFLDTTLWCISSSHKKRPFLLRRLTLSCISPFWCAFWTILAKNIRDSFARINQSFTSGLSDVCVISWFRLTSIWVYLCKKLTLV